MNVGDIESHIRAIANGDFDVLDSVDKRIAEATKSRPIGMSDEDRKTIATAWAGFASTPGGKMALQALIDRTLNRPVYLAHLGYSAEQAAIYGAHREGQNFVV